VHSEEAQPRSIYNFCQKPSPLRIQKSQSATYEPIKPSKFSNNKASEKENIFQDCECPHILVADDDPFQNFYYETLFKTCIKWQEVLGTTENFRFELFPTGETLLARFDKIKSCKCGRTVLVITDYNMGLKKLNGVQTVSALRKAGFSGSVVLRTSEEKEDLYKAHPNLSEMLMSETISCFVEKNNLKKAKDAIQNLVKKMRD